MAAKAPNTGRGKCGTCSDHEKINAENSEHREELIAGCTGNAPRPLTRQANENRNAYTRK